MHTSIAGNQQNLNMPNADDAKTLESGRRVCRSRRWASRPSEAVTERLKSHTENLPKGFSPSHSKQKTTTTPSTFLTLEPPRPPPHPKFLVLGRHLHNASKERRETNKRKLRRSIAPSPQKSRAHTKHKKKKRKPQKIPPSLPANTHQPTNHSISQLIAPYEKTGFPAKNGVSHTITPPRRTTARLHPSAGARAPPCAAP